jgi:hypothetical protein
MGQGKTRCGKCEAAAQSRTEQSLRSTASGTALTTLRPSFPLDTPNPPLHLTHRWVRVQRAGTGAHGWPPQEALHGNLREN